MKACGASPAHFLFQGFGGILFGLVTGWIAYRAMAAVDDPMVEILISIGVCAATYALSLRLNVSGPIAVVVTGLLIGNHGAEHAMSEKVQEYLFSFWEVIDELLNSVLFLLIGLEVLVLAFEPGQAWIVLASIPIVLAARLISVALPITVLSIRQTFSSGSIPILTWGGLRGGVSVALALSLPESDAKPVILAATYAVVIFSIIVQGLTVKWVIRKTADRSRAGRSRAPSSADISPRGRSAVQRSLATSRLAKASGRPISPWGRCPADEGGAKERKPPLAPLLVPQRLDRVEPGAAQGREEAERQADRRREADGQQDHRDARANGIDSA